LSFIVVVVATKLACCAFIVLNTRQNVYNAVIIKLPAVPSNKLCAQFQAMNGGIVGSALNEWCLVHGTVTTDSQETLW
jgi:hypothetical protein